MRPDRNGVPCRVAINNCLNFKSLVCLKKIQARIVEISTEKKTALSSLESIQTKPFEMILRVPVFSKHLSCQHKEDEHKCALDRMSE